MEGPVLIFLELPNGTSEQFTRSGDIEWYDTLEECKARAEVIKSGLTDEGGPAARQSEKACGQPSHDKGGPHHG